MLQAKREETRCVVCSQKFSTCPGCKHHVCEKCIEVCDKCGETFCNNCLYFFEMCVSHSYRRLVSLCNDCREKDASAVF